MSLATQGTSYQVGNGDLIGCREFGHGLYGIMGKRKGECFLRFSRIRSPRPPWVL